VQTWLRTVDDNAFRVSAITFLEKREGLVRERKKLVAKSKDTLRVDKEMEDLDAFGDACADREVPIDRKIADEWARLLGASKKHERDMALAATARVKGMVVVTRNVDDFVGRDVRVLNPFDKTPEIRTV
jgi:predicted nucleic acid-binding protein